MAKRKWNGSGIKRLIISRMEITYQGVIEERETIVAELARKGIEKPKGFSALEQFIKDRLSECE